jgi:hypothetical protein
MTQSPKIQKPKRKEKLSEKEQSERFNKAAHELQSVDTEEFSRAVATIVKPRKTS